MPLVYTEPLLDPEDPPLLLPEDEEDPPLLPPDELPLVLPELLLPPLPPEDPPLLPPEEPPLLPPPDELPLLPPLEELLPPLEPPEPLAPGLLAVAPLEEQPTPEPSTQIDESAAMPRRTSRAMFDESPRSKVAAALIRGSRRPVPWDDPRRGTGYPGGVDYPTTCTRTLFVLPLTPIGAPKTSTMRSPGEQKPPASRSPEQKSASWSASCSAGISRGMTPQ
jgi:hypothetical protein